MALGNLAVLQGPLWYDFRVLSRSARACTICHYVT